MQNEMNEAIEVIVDENEAETVTEPNVTDEEKVEEVAVSDEVLYEMVAKNEAVKNRVIADYLASIGKGIRLVTANGAKVGLKTNEVKTLDQASALAAAYFRKFK